MTLPTVPVIVVHLEHTTSAWRRTPEGKTVRIDIGTGLTACSGDPMPDPILAYQYPGVPRYLCPLCNANAIRGAS
jgi:hypothetical protein